MQDNNMIHSPLRAIQEEIEQTEKEIHHLEQQVKAKNNVVSKLTRRERPKAFAAGKLSLLSGGYCSLWGTVAIPQLPLLLHFITGDCAPPAPVPGYPLALLPSGSMALTIPENGGADYAMPAL